MSTQEKLKRISLQILYVNVHNQKLETAQRSMSKRVNEETVQWDVPFNTRSEPPPHTTRDRVPEITPSQWSETYSYNSVSVKTLKKKT